MFSKRLAKRERSKDKDFHFDVPENMMVDPDGGSLSYSASLADGNLEERTILNSLNPWENIAKQTIK